MNARAGTIDDETLGQRAYQRLREDILTGRLQQGQRLSLRTMAQVLGMSIAPVGEAFRELARDGLIETETRWGTRVRRLDLQTLKSQHILRMAIECEAVRQCATSILPAHLAELTGIADELDASVAVNADPEEVFAFDARFHLRIAQCSGVPLLAESLRGNQLIRLLARGSRIAHGRPSLQRQHGIVIDAIRTGDPEAAERVMRAHCVHSMTVQLEFFAAQDLGAEPDAGDL